MQGFAVDTAASATDGLRIWRAADYDAAVLDLMLPDGTGLNALKEMRDRGSMTPVLILTALGTIEDRVRGLDCGADDYLVKPFAMQELIARLRALLRRPGWRKTLQRLPTIRYRRPYCARHSSVSWNLMIGRSALRVAQQHGHSIETMLRIYAAWTPGAVDADLAMIERAMISTPRRGFSKERERFPPSQNSLEWALDWSLGDPANAASVGPLRRYLAEREGFEPAVRFRRISNLLN